MTKPQLWIGTSWKMNKVLTEALAFANGLANTDAQCDPRIQRFVIPSFTTVRNVNQVLSDSSVKVGVQNMHWLDSGPWTGEVSPLMAKDCGAQMVELGHSERREYFGETDETVGLKTEAAVRHSLVPLICIGETLIERQENRVQEVLENQVKIALGKLSDSQKSATILLAYEPVWAIGEHGTPATPDYADTRHAEIISYAESAVGHKVPCLYGGSVNRQNCEDLIQCPHIDGLFIGRAAWHVNDYLDILSMCSAKI